MSEENLPISTNLDTTDLQLQLEQLQREFDTIEQKVQEFKALLYSHLADEIVEVQELTVIYKELKLAKKQKRVLQKQRGKKYIAPKGLKVVSASSEKTINTEDLQEKKRLYKEAMFHVHPDKFSMKPEHTELATEVTTKLIQIYKEDDLETLKAYHAHIFSNVSLTELTKTANVQIHASETSHIKIAIETLKAKLHQLKNSSLHKILTEYENPYVFIDELKVYYKDKLSKLRKRTRKAFK
ncbi:hypothetical protein IMCC3317_15750 [Kordia antarctica]|uniref:J domain-containing protein n=1 Tax=Kordia antarctica TaxID=1218801 RepID=A0A7L4ZJ44_9FLAO|nr:hypothetical protein [Kordia antarctica]QHI36216.1 hypothetical protein IMCC3317_15750 [Kordia antarctica]